jgi:N-acetylglucosaminyldiphosphoundecaprenol N-acetyl-beta-D-mannosaminyltransferase
MNSLNILGFKVHTSIEKLDFTQRQLVVNTINPHCYCETKKDAFYHEALLLSDILIPDGIGIVWAVRLLPCQKTNPIFG